MKDLAIERRGDKNYYIAAGLGSLNLSPHLFFFLSFFLWQSSLPLPIFLFGIGPFSLVVLLWFYGLFCFGFMVCFALVFFSSI
jgi:hypothetical protein